MSRRMLEIAGAVALGGLLFLAVVLVLGSGNDSGNDTAPPESESTELEPAQIEPLVGPVAPDDFLAAYERSLSGPYLLFGSRTRFEDHEKVDSLPIKQVRLEGRSFLLEGSSVVIVEDGLQQVCQVTNDIVGDCGPKGRTPNNETIVAVFALPLLIDPEDERSPMYKLYEVDETCWKAIATRPLPLEPWGQATTWCFDQETGALIRRETATGNTSFVFEAQSVTKDVTASDLSPVGAG